MQNPKVTGCALFTIGGNGSRVFANDVYANNAYASGTVETSLSATTLANSFRMCRLRHMTIHLIGVPVLTTVEIEDGDSNTLYVLPLLAAEITSGRVIKFPGDGLLIEGPWALNKSSVQFNMSITYDWVL